MPQVFEDSVPNPRLMDLYINIIPPPRIVGQVPTGVIGRVGTADWGPVNIPVLVGSPGDGGAKFGGKSAAGAADKHDLATHREISFAQAKGQSGLQIYEVRVVDGTEAKAAYTLLDTTGTPKSALIFTAKYHGTAGNDIDIKVEAGTLTNTYTVSIIPFVGGTVEVYKNILHTGIGASSFWTALKSAINNGYDGRPPSELVVASNGADFSTGIAPALGTFSMTGGASGRGVDTATLLGQEATAPATGVYALRDLDPIVSIFSIPGCTDTTIWASLIAFAKSAGMYSIVSFATGTSNSSAISSRKSLGIDSKYMIALKDFVKIYDSTLKSFRSVTPDSALAGIMGVLGPHESPGNKQVSFITGTERDDSPRYSNAELEQLEQAGINLIMNPIPRGSVFGLRHGRNTCSTEPECAIEHTRMINYLVQVLGKNLGQFVAEKQTKLANDPTRKAIRDKINSIFGDLKDKGWIEGWSVVCDLTNNSADSIARHFCKADVKVTFVSSIWYFVVSLEGGVNVVTITQGPDLGNQAA